MEQGWAMRHDPKSWPSGIVLEKWEKGDWTDFNKKKIEDEHIKMMLDCTDPKTGAIDYEKLNKIPGILGAPLNFKIDGETV